MFYILGDLLKTIIAQYLKHDEAFILKLLYIWLLFLLFQQRNCIQKREQWFGERKRVRKSKENFAFTGKIYENDNGSILEPIDYYSNIADEHILNLVVEESNKYSIQKKPC